MFTFWHENYFEYCKPASAGATNGFTDARFYSMQLVREYRETGILL